MSFEITIRAKTWADFQQQLREAFGAKDVAAPPVVEPPAPPVVEPPAPPVVEPPAPPVVELDTQGHPWDKRIHASTKSKISDGSWKLKRGADLELVARVRGESATEPPAAAAAEPPAAAAAAAEPPASLDELSEYIMKIVEQSAMTYLEVRKELVRLGYSDLAAVPPGDCGDVALALFLKSSVSY